MIIQYILHFAYIKLYVNDYLKCRASCYQPKCLDFESRLFSKALNPVCSKDVHTLPDPVYTLHSTIFSLFLYHITYCCLNIISHNVPLIMIKGLQVFLRTTWRIRVSVTKAPKKTNRTMRIVRTWFFSPASLTDAVKDEEITIVLDVLQSKMHKTKHRDFKTLKQACV